MGRFPNTTYWPLRNSIRSNLFPLPDLFFIYPSPPDRGRRKGYQRIESPKDYEHRSIPVPEFLVEMLRAQIKNRAGSSPVFYGMRTKTYLRNHAFRKGWFDPASTDVGLDGLTPHELRHTAASLAVSSGAHVKAVKRMLGHASAAMTLDTYADLFDDDLDTVAEALHRDAIASNVSKLIPQPA